jgi:hypothetical protein
MFDNNEDLMDALETKLIELRNHMKNPSNKLLFNFFKEESLKYENTVNLYNEYAEEDILYIVEEAYARNGMRLHECRAVNCDDKSKVDFDMLRTITDIYSHK